MSCRIFTKAVKPLKDYGIVYPVPFVVIGSYDWNSLNYCIILERFRKFIQSCIRLNVDRIACYGDHLFGQGCQSIRIVFQQADKRITFARFGFYTTQAYEFDEDILPGQEF